VLGSVALMTLRVMRTGQHTEGKAVVVGSHVWMASDRRASVRPPASTLSELLNRRHNPLATRHHLIQSREIESATGATGAAP
jgi:hypothetical protein